MIGMDHSTDPTTLKAALLKLLREDDELYALLKEHHIEKKNRKILDTIQYKGHGIKLNGEIHISSPQYVILGNNVHIGNGAFIKSDGGVTIGDHVHISRNVTIYTTNHDYEGTRLPYDENSVEKPVVIEKNVWIGMNVNITPGVTIGEGSIIAMGTTVSKNVPKYSIVGNAPQRLIKQRNLQHYQQLNKLQQVGAVNGQYISTENFWRTGKECQANLFFVVSTGRAGSTSIAAMLSQHSQIACLHEPNPLLIRMSYELAYGIKGMEQITTELKHIYADTGVFQENTIYGESDQKLGNLILPLAELLPDAKFIWLIRNAEDFVTSSYSRGWFQENEFEHYDKKHWLTAAHHRKYRIDLKDEEWKKLDAFGKCCYYWSFWNKTIEQQLERIAPKRWMQVKMEEIDTKTEAILHFLNAKNEPFSTIKTNIAQQPLTPKKAWEAEQVDLFKKYCQPYMDKWYADPFFANGLKKTL